LKTVEALKRVDPYQFVNINAVGNAASLRGICGESWQRAIASTRDFRNEQYPLAPQYEDLCVSREGKLTV